MEVGHGGVGDEELAEVVVLAVVGKPIDGGVGSLDNMGAEDVLKVHRETCAGDLADWIGVFVCGGILRKRGWAAGAETDPLSALV